MAKTRNDAPPGGDAGGIFDKDNRPAAEVPPPAEASPPAEAPRPAAAEVGRKTTRGMLPEIKAVDVCYKELCELSPAEARWVLDFLVLKFPKPPEAK